jgi:shikimate dehydrogenase
MNLYGLIGYPLGHSFSKQYFTEKFAREGLSDCRFEAFPISSIDQFTALIEEHTCLKGLSVTIPYKEQVLDFVTELSDEVKYIGATNSIKIIGEKLIAYNTDIIGFEQSFCKGLQSHHKRALVLGTGGASKAVQYVLKKLAIDFLVVTRNENLKTGHINYSMVDARIMNEYHIIINCTPIGMSPKENASANIPYQFINSNHYLYDLVYKPGKTQFLQEGEQKGAIIQNGYEMLLVQAEASWKIWNDR